MMNLERSPDITTGAVEEIPAGFDFRRGNIVSVKTPENEIDGGWIIQGFNAENGDAILEKEGQKIEVARTELEAINYEAIKERIADSSKFFKLAKALRSADAAAGGIPNSDGRLEGSKYWNEQIDNLRKSHPSDKKANFITNTAKLRDKAVSLMKAGQGIEEARDPDELFCGLEWAEDIDGNKKEGYENLLNQIFRSNRFNLIKSLPDEYSLKDKVIELVLARSVNLQVFDNLLRAFEETGALTGYKYSVRDLKARIGFVSEQIKQEESPTWDSIPRIARSTVKRILENKIA